MHVVVVVVGKTDAVGTAVPGVEAVAAPRRALDMHSVGTAVPDVECLAVVEVNGVGDCGSARDSIRCRHCPG